MIEREMQELLWLYPERLLNEPLKQFAWEVASAVGRADLVFEDKHGRLLIIEVKHGKLPRGAIDQLLDYFGMMKQQFPHKAVEMMVVANAIPGERRLTCESRDIECREISERTFREVANEFGYRFASEEIAQQKPTLEAPKNIPERVSMPTLRERGSGWSFLGGTPASSDAADFLSRCDDEGKQLFSALFDAQKEAPNQTKITWKHESGFSLQFYFPRIGFAALVWGFPAQNREGRAIRQRIDFPFDFSIRAGVSQEFVEDFGTSLAAIVPLSGGGKRPSISVAGLRPEQMSQVVDTIFKFATKAAGR